jgi:hypothetical protein
MAIKRQLNLLLNKQMDRQDFLKHVAIGVVALTGAGTALRLLTPDSKPTQVHSSNDGYGSTAYGGAKEKKTV